MTKSKTLIFIHGYRGTHHGLSLIKKEFKNENVIVPDLPGFAAGESLDRYDLDSYVAWLYEFIKKQNLSELPVLLGHSFGTIVCAAYAAKYPDTIGKLILVNPIGAPALKGPRAFMSQLTAFYYWIGKKLPARLARPWLSSKLIVYFMGTLMVKSKDKKLKKFINDQHLKYFSLFHSPRSVAEGFMTSISHNVRESAPHITTPTLLIVGEKDDITSVKQQRELYQLFADVKLEIIKNVGHLTHYETPDQVARLVQDFIKSE